RIIIPKCVASLKSLLSGTLQLAMMIASLTRKLDPEHLKKELDELVGAIEEHFFQPQKYNLQPKAE
ncbi:phosphoglucomutase 1, isoform CRA_a, partial [Mus musculus]